MYDFLIVGAGFAGAVLAERLTHRSDKRVLVVDKRNHIGGNAYDYFDESKILVHKYGPHIFHTNSSQVFNYLSQFTKWRFYEHRTVAKIGDQLLPVPINLTTVNKLYNFNFDSKALREYLDSVKEDRVEIKNSEDAVVSQVGWDLYEKIFRGYTKKQWGLDPSQLDKSVVRRIPTRTNTDDRYFTDKYQFMPLKGYTYLINNMLKHPNIDILLNTTFEDIKDTIRYKSIIYTGRVDEYFKFCYGELPYRSLKFKRETINTDKFQPTGIVTYPNDHPYTRITEYKHLTGQKVDNKTSISYEFPCWEGEPFYPVSNAKNARLYSKYRTLLKKLKNVHFVGRLATYRYYNMDQVVAQALTLYKNLKTR